MIQRILQKKNWQVRKRPVGHCPRVKVVPSQAPERDIRWSTDLARVWSGWNQWCHLTLVIDCGSRELLGWRLSSRGHTKTAEAALEEALIHRFGHLGSDNGLVFTSKRYTNTVRSYGLTQEFITPYTPEQNGIVERFIKCHRFLDSALQHGTAS